MTRFHDGYPDFPVKWIPPVPGERNDDLPGPWPDINKNSIVQSSTPYLIESDE